MNNKQINKSLVADLRKDLASISMPDLLIKDIETRMTGISVAPDDMLRNRIYPVGATLGFIMDGLKIDWKGRFQAAGTDVSFPKIIIEHFDLDTNCLKNYLDIAKIHYQYQEIYLQSGDLIRDYFSSYQEAKKEFEISLQYNENCPTCQEYIKKSEETYMEIHYKRGVAHFGKEQLVEAIMEWELVRAIDSNYKEVANNIKKAKILLKRLEEIKKSQKAN